MLRSEVGIFCLVNTNPLLIEESMPYHSYHYHQAESAHRNQLPYHLPSVYPCHGCGLVLIVAITTRLSQSIGTFYFIVMVIVGITRQNVLQE